MPDIMIPAANGESFKAYISLPKKPAPAVIMIQEIFGVNDEMREKCDEIAEEGYVAVCPDLFWRIEPDIRLNDNKPEELERAFELFEQFDVAKGVQDLKAVADYMGEFDACRGPIGAMGFCLGGKLSYLMACEGDVDAAISYYGVGIENLTEYAQGIKSHVLMHVAEEDEFVSKDAQERIKLALMPNRRFDIYTYPNCNHAFARKGGKHFDPTAAREAQMKSYAFFDKYLRGNNTPAVDVPEN